MANVKMTKRDMFNAIIALANVTPEIVEFCEHEIQLLDNKKASGSKPTKTQLENVTLCEEIFADLCTVDAPVTVSEFMKMFGKYAERDFTLNKISAMFKKLVDSGKVEKTADKKKSLFKAIVEE